MYLFSVILNYNLTSITKKYLPYFIKYNVHTSIVCTWISQWFLAKKLFLFFKNNFTRINHCKFIHHRSHLKPFLSYLPCIVLREYFSIIFHVKKCALYSIKYSNFMHFRRWKGRPWLSGLCHYIVNAITKRITKM